MDDEILQVIDNIDDLPEDFFKNLEDDKGDESDE